MAVRARVLEGVACHAGALIEHCQLSVGAGLEQRQRLMAARQLVMAADTIIGSVAGGACSAIEGREFAVDIVQPTGGMRRGLHHLMTWDALIFRRERWGHVLMTSETLRV